MKDLGSTHLDFFSLGAHVGHHALYLVRVRKVRKVRRVASKSQSVLKRRVVEVPVALGTVLALPTIVVGVAKKEFFRLPRNLNGKVRQI